MAFEHDRRYKHIFSHPYFLQKLLESFVNESFIKKLDFSTLKRIDKSFINLDFQEKESDLVFTVEFNNQTIYIFLLIEFQSTVDKLMPVRFLRYITELYESLQDNFKGKKFPAVFPVLLYSGDDRWTAQFEIGNIIEKNIPQKYIPHFSYYPILENEIPKGSLEKIKNAVSAIFFIENSTPEELKDEIDRLISIISNEDLEIVRKFSQWFNNYLLNISGIEKKEMLTQKIENVMEVKAMFATKMKEYGKKLTEEGRQEGRQEGISITAQKMKELGVSLDIISKSTGLSEKEIEKL